MLMSSQNRVRQRTYVVGHHVRPGFRFVPIVKHPAHTRCQAAAGEVAQMLCRDLALARPAPQGHALMQPLPESARW